MTRKEILAEAEKCVCSDRNMKYGEPEDNFSVIAKFWSAFLDIDSAGYSVCGLDLMFRGEK